MALRLFFPLLCCLAGPAYACMVVSVADGDTLTLFCDGKKRVVDIAEIDAPELQQEFGTRSRQSLSDMCLRRNAELHDEREIGPDHVVARVICEGVPAGPEQLRRGMAWVSETHAEDKTLYVAQNIARHAGRGLWSGEAPVAPWEWRRVVAANEAQTAAKPRAARRAAPPPPEPDNPVFAFFRRIFGQD